MHERLLMESLVGKVASILRREGDAKAVSVKIRVDPLFFPSEVHLRDHFTGAARGSVLEGIRLDIVWMKGGGISPGDALRVESVEVEQE